MSVQADRIEPRLDTEPRGQFLGELEPGAASRS